MNKSVKIIGAIAALTLAGCATTVPTVNPSEAHGIIATHWFKPAGDHYPVRITEIDGRNITAPDRTVYWVAPGKHTIKVLATIDVRTSLATPNPVRVGYPSYELELEVEQGKRYLIAAKWNRKDALDWEPIVYKVSDI